MKRTGLLIPVMILFHACTPQDSTGVASGVDEPQLARQLTEQWGPAVRVNGPVTLNTPALEGCPSESPDGRSLFFASNRGPSDIDIYVSHRQPNGEWGDPERLPKGSNSVNSTANDYCPTALPGGHLMFVSERSDGLNCGTGTADIYETYYDPAEGWAAPQHLSCVVNSAASEFAPSYVGAGGGMLFFSSSRSSGKHSIYVSERGSDGEWQQPTPVTELNASGYNTFRPNVSADGREIVFDSDRPTSTGVDIWYANRANVNVPWSAPVRLPGGGGTAINSAAGETRASLSRDGQRLYFGSNRNGVSFDLFVAERQ